VLLAPAAAASVHNGRCVALLLQSLHVPFHVGHIRPGTEAKAVYHNWLGEHGLLRALGSSFGLRLRPSEPARLLGGDPEILASVVSRLHERAAESEQQTLKPELPSSPPSSRKAHACAYFSGDALENIGLAATQCAGVYAAVIACLLVVFVPQLCPPAGAWKMFHECSLKENLTPPLSQFNLIALTLNFVTLGLVWLATGIFTYREHFLIKHFDIDDELPRDALNDELPRCPELQSRLAKCAPAVSLRAASRPAV
jgi:hypothetical protein